MGERGREGEKERDAETHGLVTTPGQPRVKLSCLWGQGEGPCSLSFTHSLSLSLFLALSLCVLVFPAALSNCLRFCRGFVCGMQQFWSCSQRLTKCDVRVADGDADAAADGDADVDTEVVSQIRTTTSCACVCARVCVPVCVCSFKLLVHRCGNRQTRILRSSFMTTRLHSLLPFTTTLQQTAGSVQGVCRGGEANWIGLERTALLTYRWRQHKHGTNCSWKRADCVEYRRMDKRRQMENKYNFPSICQEHNFCKPMLYLIIQWRTSCCTKVKFLQVRVYPFAFLHSVSLSLDVFSCAGSSSSDMFSSIRFFISISLALIIFVFLLFFFMFLELFSSLTLSKICLTTLLCLV